MIPIIPIVNCNYAGSLGLVCLNPDLMTASPDDPDEKTVSACRISAGVACRHLQATVPEAFPKPAPQRGTRHDGDVRYYHDGRYIILSADHPEYEHYLKHHTAKVWRKASSCWVEPESKMSSVGPNTRNGR